MSSFAILIPHQYYISDFSIMKNMLGELMLLSVLCTNIEILQCLKIMFTFLNMVIN